MPFFDGFAFNAKVFLNPFPFTQITNGIAAHATKPVSGRCNQNSSNNIGAACNNNGKDKFGTKGHNSCGQKTGQEKTPKAIIKKSAHKK